MVEFSWKTLWIFLFFFIVGIKASLDQDKDAEDAGWWSGAQDQELEDERRDAEILRAVRDSMLEWEARKKQRSRYKRASPSICYPPLGCFSASGPFTYLDTLPSPPEEVSTTFLLYPGRRSGRSVPSNPNHHLPQRDPNNPSSNPGSQLGSGGPRRSIPSNSQRDQKSQKSQRDPNSPSPSPGIQLGSGGSGGPGGPPGGGSPLAEVPWRNISDAFQWAKMHFNPQKETKILVHGFGSSCHYVWVYEMRSALMAVDDYNIVCVDWEHGAVLPNYVKAAANTRLVGAQLALLLKGLEEHAGLSRTSMHLIGFSLGAHVAGFAGSEMRNISRITGLDPAGPLFETQSPEARLDSTDAKFVDVIHSNGENLFLGGLGSWQPMGHVDFYPNGGRMQKGCSNLFVGAVSDFIWSSDVEGRSLCNHRRAYKFFVDSVSPRCHFPAFPCESYDAFLEGRCFPCTNERHCGNMGYYADKAVGRGQLFLITRDEEPFCAHQYSVKIESSSMSKPLINYGKIKITLVGESDLNETFTITNKDDEELLPGAIVSRILVPHPIIAEPTKVQILYQGYTGWLSSGLKKWRIDKVSMMDSFGKTSSVCKKGLELISGIPATLKLYPGNCNIPKDGQNFEQEFIEDRISSENNTGQYPPGFEPASVETNKKFIPTPVVRIGNEAIKGEGIKNILQDEGFEKKDKIDTYVPWKTYENNNLDESSEVETTRAFNTKSVKGSTRKEDIKEVVEPILKKPGNKNARSHDLSKPEITEPILGPTTVKPIGTSSPNLISRLLGERELNYQFEDEFVPGDKFKRHDLIQTERVQTSQEEGPLKMIMMTVQFLPQRLSKMFEQAEKYARETIFPLISQHTPKFITNFITPKEREQPKYVPLNYTDTEKSPAKRVDKTDFSPPDIPIKLARTDNESLETTSSKVEARNLETTTEKIQVVYPEKIKETTTMKTEKDEKVSRKIYVDLPVFDERDIGVKYIPLVYPDHIKPEKITKR